MISRALARKELRDHGWVLLASLLLSSVICATLLHSGEREGGRFVALLKFAAGAGTLDALVLAHRLFVREYASRTQLFLEVLPLRRAEVFATKWLLGWAAMTLLVLAAWAANLAFIRRTELISLADALLPLGNALLFAWMLWAGSAMAAMLGRYRYLAWIAACGLLSAIVSVGGIPLRMLGPLRLIGHDVAMAKASFDAVGVLSALGITLVATAAAAALALWGSGAIASVLAQRMTTRERVFVLVALLASSIGLTALRPKPVKPPFLLARAERVRAGAVNVGVMRTRDVDADAARKLGATLGDDLTSLIASLQLDTKANVSILPQRGLDRTSIRRAHLSETDGIVLSVAPDVPRPLLRTEVLHELLATATRGRAGREDRHVLLDGFAALWALRDDPAARDLWWLRAASVDEVIGERALRDWASSSERWGICIASAVAFAAIDALDRHIGRARLLQLARAAFARPPDDVRVLFEPGPARWLAAAGTSYSGLATALERSRREVRQARGAELAARPALRGDVHAAYSAARGHTLEVRVSADADFWALYGLLGPWTTYVPDLSRLDVHGRRAVLPLSPPRGSLALVAIETEDPVLDCPVRLAARRVELP